jgi:hypothetical protein
LTFDDVYLLLGFIGSLSGILCLVLIALIADANLSEHRTHLAWVLVAFTGVLALSIWGCGYYSGSVWHPAAPLVERTESHSKQPGDAQQKKGNLP